MFIIIGKQALRAIAVVVNFEAGGFEAVHQSCGAKCGRSFLASGLESGGAGRRTDQRNLLRLTDDFDRQSMAPCDCVPAVRLRYGLRRAPVLQCRLPLRKATTASAMLLVASMVLKVGLRSFASLRMTTLWKRDHHHPNHKP